MDDVGAGEGTADGFGAVGGAGLGATLGLAPSSGLGSASLALAPLGVLGLALQVLHSQVVLGLASLGGAGGPSDGSGPGVFSSLTFN